MEFITHSAKASVKRQLMIVVLAYGCWKIWKSRNKKRFEDRYTSSEQSVHVVLSQILHVTTIFPPSCKSTKDFIWRDKGLVGKLRREVVASPIVLKWSPPPHPVHMLNTTEPFRAVQGLASGKGALRNHQGKILVGFSHTCSCNSSLEAGARAGLGSSGTNRGRFGNFDCSSYGSIQIATEDCSNSLGDSILAASICFLLSYSRF
ncbi:hypothetical protein ACH5RR_026031 [Cinchona calisaya]|uniref:Uncharacterized protein n=1 Tax=Cinchona calisaya TaxID=153742 RepID=A0ABD2Z1C2_9GENT